MDGLVPTGMQVSKSPLDFYPRIDMTADIDMFLLRTVTI